jgi:hypothetical protein
VCDQETPKREAKGPSWTISACERMNEIKCYVGLDKTGQDRIYDTTHLYRILKEQRDDKGEVVMLVN